jgi:hypothetical protein
VSSEQWERGWRLHWQKTGFSPYELPVSDSIANGERDFLMQPRTLNREHARLKRIMVVFEHGFRSLHKLGPAVTVFGSARFKPGHPYYELGRQVGQRLAEAGLTVITGGGPALWRLRTAARARQADPLMALTSFLLMSRSPILLSMRILNSAKVVWIEMPINLRGTALKTAEDQDREMISPAGALDFRMTAELQSDRAEAGTQRTGRGGDRGGVPFMIQGTTSSPKFVPDVGGIAGNVAKGALQKSVAEKSGEKTGLGGIFRRK